jgi:predicted esterase
MPQHIPQSSSRLTVAPGLPPHAGQPVLTTGAELSDARAMVLAVHGRGATASDILTLAAEFQDDTFSWIAPQASGRTWYPFSFLSPLQTNEPGLSSALSVLDGILREAEHRGIASERVVLMGFSQGACLALEYAARHARRFGGVVGFSGGLIGPAGTRRDYAGDFAGTPVFLGCSDRDPHIPAERVQDTAEVMSRMGAHVDMRLYQGMAHTIIDEEIKTAGQILRNAVG